MKKIILLMVMLLVLPLSAIATTFYFVVEDSVELDGSDNFMTLGKPADAASFSSGNCDGGDWEAGDWNGVTFLSGDDGGGSPARIGTAYFVSNSALGNGQRLTSLTESAGTCTQSILGTTWTFEKFSAQD